MDQTFDYVIVGAGSAGCVLAHRLTEDAGVTVLLLEAGGSGRSLFIQMPSALSIPMNMARYNWHFESEPEPHLNGRRLHCPRGKVLGGSSSINGMVYARGHARDFDEWQEHGAAGWSYSDCLPYFRKAETWTGGGDAYRGGQGPLATCAGNGMKNPLYRAFIEAGRQAGYPETPDANGCRQEGFGPMHMTVKGGVRASTANAYLKAIRKRPNLEVVTGALSERVVLHGRRAAGVAYRLGGQIRTARAAREVILCAGSIGSPHLLQVSGIGPGAVLREAGVTPVHDLPGVGANLQDHLEVYVQFRCTRPITLNARLNPVAKFLIGDLRHETKLVRSKTHRFGKRLDASLLMLPLVRFIKATDPRMRATIEGIATELTSSQGLVYRYHGFDDGLEGSEGAFTICTFWLVDNLLLLGEVDRAAALLEQLRGYANDLGLFSEEIDPDSGEMLGNFPQAFSHMAFINTAVQLQKALARQAKGA